MPKLKEYVVHLDVLYVRAKSATDAMNRVENVITQARKSWDPIMHEATVHTQSIYFADEPDSEWSSDV